MQDKFNIIWEKSSSDLHDAYINQRIINKDIKNTKIHRNIAN